jgi:hypothetical protein
LAAAAKREANHPIKQNTNVQIALDREKLKHLNPSFIDRERQTTRDMELDQ